MFEQIKGYEKNLKHLKVLEFKGTGIETGILLTLQFTGYEIALKHLKVPEFFEQLKCKSKLELKALEIRCRNFLTN